LIVERLPLGAGTFAIAVGSMVLVGWTFDVDVLKSAGHVITMKPNAAISLIACGTALVAGSVSGWTLSSVVVPAALLSAVLGLLTLSEHVAGWNLGIDQLLFSESPGAPGTASPNRMGINASTSFSLAGTALIALTRRSRRTANLAQWLAVLVATLAAMAIVGYTYGAGELYSMARYTGIAWPTAVTLLAIAVGILSARPDVDPIATLVSDGPGGIMARRMLIAAIVIPVTLGYFRIRGQQADYFDTGLGTALLVVSLILVLTATVWNTALRLDETNRARETAREQAERANRLKDEFLTSLSHELRTPLNAILGWTEMLRVNAVAPEQRTQAAEVIIRNGKLLSGLIEDLLDVSRIMGKRLPLTIERLDLNHIAAAAVEAASPQAATKGIRILSHCDDAPAFVHGDAMRLQQVVGNLLSNAVKFTPAGGAIDLDVRVDGTGVELHVTDSGKGMTPEFLPHVFDRFRQEDGTATREHGGLGLGLAIVRELTELHGGSVQAFSAGPGLGSHFIIRFPLADQLNPQLLNS
jgi:signal transduction histidine kinase